MFVIIDLIINFALASYGPLRKGILIVQSAARKSGALVFYTILSKTG